MLFDIHDRINVAIGMIGWLLAMSKIYLSNINDVIILVSSVLGIIMLAISIRTAVVKYQIKKVELKKLKKELDEK